MKKKVKVSMISNVFNIIGNARYGKLNDEEKIKVWRISRVLQPIANKFKEDNDEAAKKLKPTDKDFDEKAGKMFQFENMMRSGNCKPEDLPMGIAEHNEFVEKKWNPYNKLVADAVKEFGEKEVEIEFEPLSDEALSKLMGSNEWTFAVVNVIADVICE